MTNTSHYSKMSTLTNVRVNNIRQDDYYNLKEWLFCFIFL